MAESEKKELLTVQPLTGAVLAKKIHESKRMLETNARADICKRYVANVHRAANMIHLLKKHPSEMFHLSVLFIGLGVLTLAGAVFGITWSSMSIESSAIIPESERPVLGVTLVMIFSIFAAVCSCMMIIQPFISGWAQGNPKKWGITYEYHDGKVSTDSLLTLARRGLSIHLQAAYTAYKLMRYNVDSTKYWFASTCCDDGPWTVTKVSKLGPPVDRTAEMMQYCITDGEPLLHCNEGKEAES